MLYETKGLLKLALHLDLGGVHWEYAVFLWFYIVSFTLLNLQSSQARLFDEPQLASLCLDTIDKSTADAINAEGFTDIDLGMCQSVVTTTTGAWFRLLL